MAGKAKSKPSKGRLKVFRTAIGFHDAYAAAPSRKAALKAWGTEKDLFARGVAEEVTDPALMAEPLSAPGTVFRQLRSMPADDLEAKPRRRRKQAASEDGGPRALMRPAPAPPPPPRPDKHEVDEAEAALDAAREQHQRQEQDLAARERELASERRSMEARQASELRLLNDRLETVREVYEARLAAWRKAINQAQER